MGSDRHPRIPLVPLFPLVNPILKEGTRAPAFTLPSQNGKVRLTEQRGRWVVVYFYPKDDTPGCTTEACAFRDLKKEFEKQGAVVLGISPDDRDSHIRFAEKYDLSFPVLVDRDARVANKYGAWREKKNYGRTYLGIVRSSFLIDPSGKIVRIWDNVRVKGHVEKILATLREERAG